MGNHSSTTAMLSDPIGLCDHDCTTLDTTDSAEHIEISIKEPHMKQIPSNSLWERARLRYYQANGSRVMALQRPYRTSAESALKETSNEASPNLSFLRKQEPLVYHELPSGGSSHRRHNSDLSHTTEQRDEGSVANESRFEQEVTERPKSPDKEIFEGHERVQADSNMYRVQA